MKQTVRYRIHDFDHIVEGDPAYISPMDHPSSRVSNKSVVRTTIVLHYDPLAHTFETANTLYIGVHKDEQSAT